MVRLRFGSEKFAICRGFVVEQRTNALNKANVVIHSGLLADSSAYIESGNPCCIDVNLFSEEISSEYEINLCLDRAES